jgi:hypothetical protein
MFQSTPRYNRGTSGVSRVVSKSNFLLGEEKCGMQILMPLVAARNIAAVKCMGVGYSFEFMPIGYSAVTRSS